MQQSQWISSSDVTNPGAREQWWPSSWESYSASSRQDDPLYPMYQPTVPRHPTDAHSPRCLEMPGYIAYAYTTHIHVSLSPEKRKCLVLYVSCTNHIIIYCVHWHLKSLWPWLQTQHCALWQAYTEIMLWWKSSLSWSDCHLGNWKTSALNNCLDVAN